MNSAKAQVGSLILKKVMALPVEVDILTAQEAIKRQKDMTSFILVLDNICTLR